jgi:YggT family protein
MGIIGSLVYNLLSILEFIILARVILSWIPISRDNNVLNQIVNIIYQITEPLLAPIRKMFEKFSGKGHSLPIDFSPIILFLLINVLKRIFLNSI